LKKSNQEILASFGVSLNPENNFKSAAEYREHLIMQDKIKEFQKGYLAATQDIYKLAKNNTIEQLLINLECELRNYGVEIDE